MAIISITITDSSDQTVPGIPNKVSISTNEPSTVFYSLDGSDPTTYSNIYLAPIIMPQSLSQVILKVYATNGVDNSAIIEQIYTGDLTKIPLPPNARESHSAITPFTPGSRVDLFPFGSGSIPRNSQFTNPSNASTIVYEQGQPSTPTGWDGQGNPDGYITNPTIGTQFKQIYSTTNNIGQATPGVGNLPAKVRVIGKTTDMQYIQEQSSLADKLFNPKAMVIFTDTNTDDPTNPAVINRANFSLESPEIVRDGNLLMNTALDAPPTMGGFVRSYYNPRTQEMTSYFYDNTVNRWIISKTPYASTTPNPGALQNMVFPRPTERGGEKNVYQWHLFYYRRLT
jgi:hypothetical protein